MSALCEDVNPTASVRVLAIGTLLGQSRSQYDTIDFSLFWPCIKPVFDLSANTAGPLTSSGSLTPLIQQGSPVFSAAIPYSSEGGLQTVFTVNLDRAEVWDDVALFVRVTGGALTPFTWTADLSKSINPQGLDYTMRYNSQPLQSSRSITFTPPNGTYSPPLEMMGMRCTTPGDHVLVTFLSYGFTKGIQLDFQRSCVVADDYGGEEGMNAGAIVGIVFLVMLIAVCAVGCGYNYGTQRKRGWSVVPGYGWWVAFQDRVLGPKRYSAQMEEEGEVVEIPVTSSMYGTYQGDL